MRTIYPWGWMAKAGVEPLRSLALFLFLPSRFLLLALLIFVARVFEVMGKLLKGCLILTVALPMVSVKGESAAESTPQVVVLGIGEALDVPTGDAIKYSVTQSNIVGPRFLPKIKRIVLRGKARGLAEILLWQREGPAHKITVFVHARDESPDHGRIVRRLNALGFSLELEDQKIKAKGHLETLGHYEGFAGIVQEGKHDIFSFEVSVEQRVLREVVAHIYFDFFQHYRDSISCKYEGWKILCTYYYSEGDGEEKTLVDKFAKTYAASFTAYKRKYPINFRITSKTILIDGQDSITTDLGMEMLSTNVEEILSSNASAMILREDIEILGETVNIYSFNEQESLIRVGHPLEIKVGTDQRYHRQVEGGEVMTDWRFFGLRIDLVLNREMERFFVDYSTNVSTPTSETTSRQNSKKSSFFINPGSYEKVFEIKTTSEAIMESGIPVLGQIPILENLFKRKTRTNGNIIYRTYVKLEKI